MGREGEGEAGSATAKSRTGAIKFICPGLERPTNNCVTRIYVGFTMRYMYDLLDMLQYATHLPTYHALYLFVYLNK